MIIIAVKLPANGIRKQQIPPITAPNNIIENGLTLSPVIPLISCPIPLQIKKAVPTSPISPLLKTPSLTIDAIVAA